MMISTSTIIICNIKFQTAPGSTDMANFYVEAGERSELMRSLSEIQGNFTHLSI